MAYILEVQRFDANGHITHPNWNGKKEHVGYMNKIFTTKQEACEYYALYNKNMRRITSEYNWCSDWNIDTKLLYVVRRYTGEYLKIPLFDEINHPISKVVASEDTTNS